MVRQRVGEALGHRMLEEAFSWNRDFKETLRLANLLAERYPGTRFHEHGVQFSKEMPKRLDDFKKLKLPSREEWDGLKNKLTRAEQIQFLCERMRLLNCFQLSEPGGYTIRDFQSAEPSDLSLYTVGPEQRSTYVINPYVELVGGGEGDWEAEKNVKQGMNLKVADIAVLAPFLRDDWHILCVSYWRSFHPDRQVGTTRPIFAEIIESLAKRDLSRIEAMKKMSEAEIDKHIEGIVRWVKDNENKDEQQLHWEALDADVKSGKYFSELRNIKALLRLKDKRLLPVLLKYLNEFDSKGSRYNPSEIQIEGIDVSASSSNLRTLLGYCLAFDPKAFQEPVRKFANHKNAGIRLAAGQILFVGGNLDDGRKIFADVLKGDNLADLREDDISNLVAILLKEGSEASKQTVRQIFENNHASIKLRLAAGYVLFDRGERDEARKVFADILEGDNVSEFDKSDTSSLVETLLKEGSEASKQTIRVIFKNNHAGIKLRLDAGRVLFDRGEHDEGRKVLADILENGDLTQLGEYMIPSLVEALLAEGSEASKQTAREVFKNKQLTELRDWDRVVVVNKCAQAGIGDGYLAYLPLLDIKGNSIGDHSYGPDTVVGEMFANEIIEMLAPGDPEIVRIKTTFPKAADQIEPLKAWLTAKAKELSATTSVDKAASGYWPGAAQHIGLGIAVVLVSAFGVWFCVRHKRRKSLRLKSAAIVPPPAG